MDRFAAVADGDTLGIFACSRIGTAARDSPENAGPIIAAPRSSWTALWTCGTAWSAVPWESYSTSSSRFGGFVALYWSIASFAPLRGGMTRPEFSPVRSPMNPILIVLASPPAGAPPPHAARPIAATRPIASALSLRIRVILSPPSLPVRAAPTPPTPDDLLGPCRTVGDSQVAGHRTVRTIYSTAMRHRR